MQKNGDPVELDSTIGVSSALINSVLTNKRLTWAIIFAQVFVLVIGHGRVILCHDASGTSHIELVDSESCSTDALDGCNQIADNQTGVSSTSCSGSSCVDELFQISATLSTSRKIDVDTDQGFQPLFPLAFASWLRLPDPTSFTVAMVDIVDAQLLAGQLQSIRTTVLVL